MSTQSTATTARQTPYLTTPNSVASDHSPQWPLQDIPQDNVPQQDPDPGRTAEQAAYEYINNILNANWNAPLEIEILPTAFQEDEYAVRIYETCIGIPQALLAMSMVYARLLLFNFLPQARAQGLDPWINFQQTMDASQVLLLFDPTFLTAINARKHELCKIADPDFVNATGNPTIAEDIIRKELWLLDSLQTSPLKRHTKSEYLWSHRRWLLNEFLEFVLDVQRADILGSKRMSVLLRGDTFLDAPRLDKGDILWQSFLKPELQVVCRAGERHPQNYYGWDFAVSLLDVAEDYTYTHDDLDMARLLGDAVDLVRDWCLAHTTDSSAWHFLTRLLSRADGADPGGIVIGTFVGIGNSIIELNLRQDPPWHFVRSMLASDEHLPGPFRANFVGELYRWLEGVLEEHNLKGTAAEQMHQDGGQPLYSEAYFDVVIRHMKWIRKNWQGEPRPAIFAPLATVPE